MAMQKKKKQFLGLMKKYKNFHTRAKTIFVENDNPLALSFKSFKEHYTPLLTLIYIYTSVNSSYLRTLDNINPVNINWLFYYAKLSRLDRTKKRIKLPQNFFHTMRISNIIVFSKPRKQLFLVFFKEQPKFIFTGGLMRLVINEKKKCHKKLHKVAISLIKLSHIFLKNNTYFDTCYLRLINTGSIRLKILREFKRNRVFYKINYVFLVFRFNFGAQKFKTRRAIKKYVKKRFGIN